MRDELEPFTSDEGILKLTLKAAVELKNDFAYLMNEQPFMGQDGTRYNWFRLAVAPSDYDTRMEYVGLYYRNYPYVDDEKLALMFPVKDFTVISLRHIHDPYDGISLHGTLLSIIKERELSFDIKKYVSA